MWRDLAEKFRALQHTHGTLRADWDCVAGSGGAGQWRLTGAASRTAAVQFETLAKRGASALSDVGSTDLLTAWLEFLRRGSPNFRFKHVGLAQTADGSEEPQHQTGTIRRVCEASADFCGELEGKALEAGFLEKQQDDPRNWSPLRRDWEVLKELKRLRSGPYEEIPQSVVRGVLAEQYGIKPEEVTLKQIRFEIAGLLRRYPAIRLIPPPHPIGDSRPVRAAEQTADAEAVDIGPDSTADGILPMRRSAGEALASGPDTQIKLARRAAVDSFIEIQSRRTGRRITRTDIWKSASYKTRTEFERWERNDSRSTDAAHRTFTRVLASPHPFQ